MKPLTGLSVVILLFATCNFSSSQQFPLTNHIDSAEYKMIKQEFNLESVYKVDNHLGGLTPNYPILGGTADLLDKHTGQADWMNGGIILLCHTLVVKKGNDYSLIKTKQQLKDLYAPIASKEEAFAYAILNSRYFPVLDKGYFKLRYRYYHGKPKLSYAVQMKDYYLVHLFDYKAFGCGHPYYSILLKVTKDGDVIELKKEKAFEDPKKSSLCVD